MQVLWEYLGPFGVLYDDLSAVEAIRWFKHHSAYFLGKFNGISNAKALCACRKRLSLCN